MKIKKLPDYIVARISAGEVITSPYNVLKELLENSMDVNATRITINLSSTLLSLSVQDNGPGVSREDLKIMCGNHFTSKISGLEDIRRCGTISGLGTFGFRGEALYSIGISGKLCITGKTEGESFGHKASYMGSEVMDIKKVAMDDTGTLVEVTELFYHNVIRRDHFYKNRSECMKCVDMIKSYSCLYSGIRMQVDNKTVFPADMSLKSIKISSEHNDKPTYCLGMTVVDTPSQTDKSTSNPGIIIDDENRRIIENKLDYMTRIFFDSIFIKGKLRHKVTREYFVACTGVNVVLKKYKCVVFVNSRLIKNDSFKRRVYQKYKGLLKDKEYPFVYVEIFSNFVDVNVHPGKAEVLVEDEKVFERVAESVGELIIQGLDCEGAEPPKQEVSYSQNEDSTEARFSRGSGLSSDLSRNDVIVESIDQSFQAVDSQCSHVLDDEFSSPVKLTLFSPNKHMSSSTGNSPMPEVKIYASPQARTIEESVIKRTCLSRRFSLVSLCALQSEIKEMDSSFFRSMVYVGHTDAYIFVQSQTNLISIKKQEFLREVFYNKMVRDFGNFESKSIEPCRVNIEPGLTPMLFDYFKLRVVDGHITEVPVIFDIFVKEWGSFSIEKTSEIETIKNVANGIAEIYKNGRIDSKVFNLIRKDILGTRTLIECCCMVVALRDLYKKFGRC